MILELFEPSMCCDSGVCGPEPDKVLIDLQNTILLLKKAGVQINRFAINQAPLAFVQNTTVSNFIKTNGVAKLPLTLLNGFIIKSGAYPTIEELIQHIPGLDNIKPDSIVLGIF